MNSCTNEVYTPKNVTKKSHSYLTLARADNFSKLGELSLLEFQTKATCTLPVIVCENSQHKSQLGHNTSLDIYQPFLYLSEEGRDVSYVETAIYKSNLFTQEENQYHS